MPSSTMFVRLSQGCEALENAGFIVSSLNAPKKCFAKSPKQLGGALSDLQQGPCRDSPGFLWRLGIEFCWDY